MTWSIRARLTAWYSAVVVVVLVAGTVFVDVREEQLMRQRLDDELERLMFTLQSVMRNEINEGLDLQAAADEASLEVLAPQRSLLLVRTDGSVLARWGEPFDTRWTPPLTTELLDTRSIGSVVMRVRTTPVEYRGNTFVAAVLAPLDELETASQSLRRTLGFAILIVLGAATLGGWLIARQTLQPLDEMASQATAITGSRFNERLNPSNPHDELGRLATAFNGLLDRLVYALQAQKQFMADASHELRTPVSIVRTTAQVTLERQSRTAEDYREMMEVIGEQAVRLTRLVDSMFLLSRAEARGLPLAPEPLYVDELVSESARGLQVVARERHVTVATGGDADVRFTGDPGLLQQMLTNLLDNAVHHTPRGGTVWATVSQREDGPITIRVRDEGAGVPEDARERIFERFARLSSDYPGAGLGLPIARWIAEAHGGSLVLESTGPAGSTFTVTLPRA